MQPSPIPADTLSSSASAPSPSTASTATASTYYPGFDWLRAMLAVVVTLGHDGLIPWSQSGTFAVDVFFALSGWLVGSLLLRKAPSDLPRFYFDRAARIWIPYYLALALLLAASLLRDPVTPKWLEFVGYKLLMVWNLFGSSQLADFRAAMPLKGTGNHFWSVNAEEQFYLLSPILLVLAPSWGRFPLLWAAIAAWAYWTESLYAAIVLGVLAAVVIQRWGAFYQDRWFRRAALVFCLGGAVGLVAGANYYAAGPLCAIAIVLLLAVKGTPSKLGKLAGGMSYPLYLNHWIGVYVGNALLAPFGMRESLTRQIVSVGLNVLLAIGLYWFIDRQILAHRSRWFTKGRGRAVAVVAFGMVSAGVLFGLYERQ